MTVSSDLNRISYTGNGTTTVFPVNYYFLQNEHLQVILISATGTETPQTLTANYTVTGAGNEAGGTVTMLVAPPTGTTLVIQRDVPATQETDYLANDPFPAESHERALDKLTMLVQQNERESDRALKIPLAAVQTTSTEMPLPQANRLLAWDQGGTAIINFDPENVVNVVGQQNSFADTFTGDGATTVFTLSGEPGSVANLDVSINGVTQVPSEDYTLSGNTLTFTTAPPAVASQILARFTEVYAEGVQNAVDVAFTGFQGQTGNVQNLSGDDGSDWIGFEPAGSGAVAMSIEDKLRETVSVKDFGAVGDGVTDDTAAIQAAIDAIINTNGGKLYVPTGVYKITSLITVTCDAQQHIAIVGDGRYQSTLDFQVASSLGIKFHSTSTADNQLPSFEVRHLGLITSKDNCGTALYFDYDNSNNIDATVYVADTFIGQNVDRASDDGTGFGYWTNAIRCNNARNGEIRNLHAYGEIDKSPQSSRGVWLEGESVAFVFSDSLLLEFTTGIEALDTCEGLYLSNTDIVYCRYGARHSIASGAEPQFTAVGCSFNCANVGVWLQNSQASVVADSLFFAASVLDTGTWPDWTGVLIQGTLSAFNKVIGCTFTKEIQRTGDVTTGIDFNQGAAYSSTGNHFFGFSGNELTYGIQVRSGVSNVKIGDDHVFSFVSSNVSSLGTTAVFYQPVTQMGTNLVSTGATISFDSTFNSNPTVVATHAGTNVNVNVTVANVNVNGFDVYHNEGGAANISWIASGY